MKKNKRIAFKKVKIASLNTIKRIKGGVTNLSNTEPCAQNTSMPPECTLVVVHTVEGNTCTANLSCNACDTHEPNCTVTADGNSGTTAPLDTTNSQGMPC